MQLDACSKVLDQARERNIRTIVQLGDIFENPKPKQNTILKLIQWLHINKDFEFHIILGNHDWESSDNHSFELLDFVSKSKILRHVNVYTKPTVVNFGPVHCGFVPYPFVKAPKCTKPLLCFGHFEIKGAKRDNGQVIAKGLELKTSKKLDWIIGHLHCKQPPYYPGTLYQLSFGEPLPKGYFVCEADTVNGKLLISRRWVEFNPPYKLINRVINKSKDLRNFDEPNTYYKLFIKSSISLPGSFLLENPQVLKIEHFREDVKVQEKGGLLIEDQSNLYYDPVDGLQNFLVGRGLTKKQINKAITMVKAVIGQN